MPLPTRTREAEKISQLNADVGAILDDDVAVLAAQNGVAADEHAVADRDARVVGALRVEAAAVVDDDVVADEDLVRMPQRDVRAEDDVAPDAAEDQADRAASAAQSRARRAPSREPGS